MLTSTWVATPPNRKLTKSQLESSKASNSDAILGWVARIKDPSTLAVKSPLKDSLARARLNDQWQTNLS